MTVASRRTGNENLLSELLHDYDDESDSPDGDSEEPCSSVVGFPQGGPRRVGSKALNDMDTRVCTITNREGGCPPEKEGDKSDLHDQRYVVMYCIYYPIEQ